MGNRLLVKDLFIIHPSPITYYPLFLSRLIQRKNLRKDLIIIEALKSDRTGSAGSHAETAAFAKYRIDLRLSGKGPLFDEARRRVRTYRHAHTAGTAIQRICFGNNSAGKKRLFG